MAYILPEHKISESELLDKASKLHLDAFSCWKETLYHFSTKLEILTYERNSLLDQLKEANEEKTKLHIQYREKLKTQIRKNNSLKNMINVLTRGGNEKNSPRIQMECDDVDYQMLIHDSEANTTSVNSDEGTLSSERDIICIDMEAIEENMKEDECFKETSPSFTKDFRCSSRRLENSDTPNFRNNVIVVSQPLREPPVSEERCIPHENPESLIQHPESQKQNFNTIPNKQDFQENSKSNTCIERTESSSSSNTPDLTFSNIKNEETESEKLPTTHEPANMKNFVPNETGTNCIKVNRKENAPPLVLQDTRESPMKKYHVCGECGRCFDKAFKLRKHMAIHSSDRPFKCTVCSNRFRLKHHLVEHTRVHTGYRPYRCTGCGKGFNRRGVAELHVCNGSDVTNADSFNDTETTREIGEYKD